MLPVSWGNGEYQHAQQQFHLSQSSHQLTQTSTGNYQGVTSNNTTLCGPVNRVMMLQGAAYANRDGIWQQVYPKRQVGNVHLVNNATCHGQVATLQNGHQNSVNNLSTQNLSDTIRTNITYRQDMPANGNRMFLSNENQVQWVENNLMSNNDQHNMVQRSLHQNVNGMSTEFVLAHNRGVTSTSSPSASVQIGQITQSLNYSQNAQQNTLSCTPQLRQNILLLSKKRPATINSLPNTYNYLTSNRSRINSGGVATSSINMNSQSAQQVGRFPIAQSNYNLPQLSQNQPITTNTLANKQNCQNSSGNYVCGTGVAPSYCRTNSNGNQYEVTHLTNPLAGTGQHVLKQQRINSGENISFKAPNQTLYRSPSGSSLFVSKEMMLECNQTKQPEAHSAVKSCKAKSPLIFSLLTGEPPDKNTSNMPASQLGTDTLPQQSSASKDSSVTSTVVESGDTLNRDSVEFKAQLSTEKEQELLAELEMLIHLYTNDNSIHSSGHTVPKAVAVVPPLSQKNMDTASECTSSIEECSQYTEVQKSLPGSLKEGSLHLRDNCKTPTTSDSSNKPSSTPEASSELPPSQTTNQKVVGISDQGPEVPDNIELNQRVAQACPSEVAITQDSTMDNNDTPAAPKLCAHDLSSIPTVQWTLKNLHNHIENLMLTEQPKKTPASSDNTLELTKQILKDTKKLKNPVQIYKNIMTSVYEFFGKRLDLNAIILLEVKEGFVKVLENYRVLQHEETYKEESPYVSSWLNINEKLDDIDKEFGFSRSLTTYGISDSELQQDCTSITNTEILSEAYNKSLSQMELEPADSHKEESNIDENSSEQCASPTESSADDSDPQYSFTIQVLPPEKAKIIFEENEIQLKGDRLQQKTTESCTKADSPSTEKGSHKTIDVSQMPQMCCLTKWMETVTGEKSDSMSKCQCKVDPADEDCTEGKFTSAKQTQDEENSDGNMTTSLPETDNTFTLNVDFIGPGDTPQACESENISHDSMDSSNSSIIFTSENKDQEQVPNQMFNPEADPELAPIESPGSSEYCTSEEMERKTEIATSDGSCSEDEWDCIQPELKSTDMPEPPMEEEEGEAHPNAIAAVPSPPRPTKYKRDIKTAELVLFGSTSQRTHDSIDQSPPSSTMLPDGAPKPPKMICVDIRPMEPATSETITTHNYSVKRQLYEKWRRSLPPLTTRYNKASMFKKLPVRCASLTKGKTLLPISTKRRSRMLDVHDKKFRDQMKKFLCLRKKRKSRLAKPTKCHSRGVMDPNEDSVLGFNVLPRTFSFKDESNMNNNTTDSVTDEALLAEADNKRSDKAERKTRDTWCPKPAKMYCPLRPSTVHTTSLIFHEFQQRYKQKTQTPPDA